jgi:glycosyltransferase
MKNIFSMKISLITATYNSEKNIATCLQSVAGQTHKNIEHLIIDGGSTDQTLEIVKSFPSVSKTVSEPDKGIYDALNKGIQLATGIEYSLVYINVPLAAL